MNLPVGLPKSVGIRNRVPRENHVASAENVGLSVNYHPRGYLQENRRLLRGLPGIRELAIVGPRENP